MVGPVGVAVLGGPVQVGEAELAAVDDGVVAGGEDVAVEAGGQGVVGDDLGGGPALRGGLLLPDRHAEDVVDVAVRVDGGVEAVGAPGADVVVDDLGQRRAAGVDQDEAVLGGEGRDVGEGGAEADAVGDLDEAADVVDRVEGGGRDLAVPEAVGDGEDVRWHGPPRVVRRGPAGRASARQASRRQAPGAFSSDDGAGVGGRRRRRTWSCRCRPSSPPPCPSRTRSWPSRGCGPAWGWRRRRRGARRDDDGHDEQVGTENVSQHEVSFTWVHVAVNCVPG